MATFERISGGDAGYERVKISSITVVRGDLLCWDRSNNVAILATSSTSAEDLAGVAVEAATTAETSILIQKISENDEYSAGTASASNVSMDYERMVLTDENTVNNTGTDSTSDAAVFMQIGIIGAADDKKIRGRFITRQDRA